jgi:hypothetical protein
MTYYSVPIFHGSPTGAATYRPVGPVDCYVVRATLFGVRALGARGIYHSGILCVGDSREWAFELTLDDFANLIPTIVGGRVVVNNEMTLGFYPPIDAHMWRPYWTEKSQRVCRLSPEQHDAMVAYMLGDFGPKFPRYTLFGITGKPALLLGGDARTERTSCGVYTVDNTCDKLGMRVFEWVHGAFPEVAIAPYPVTRAVLQTPTAPTAVAPDDPGLVAYARSLQAMRAEFAAVKRNDYAALLALLRSIRSAVPPFKYVLSLDANTFAQSYYVLPLDDVSFVVEDVWVQVGTAGRLGPLGPLGRRTLTRDSRGPRDPRGPRDAARDSQRLAVALGVVLAVVWVVLVVAAWLVYARIPYRAARRPAALGLGIAGMFVPPLLIGPVVLGAR